ncbi:MAG: sensor histidine kinase [Caulobacteraceae bacterium]|nr:sensor histidine kinase [Caulobacteraceae bacterium]
MSLRLRVLVAIASVLLLGAAVGVMLALWDARLSLREELAAAQLGGRQTVASAFEDLPRSVHPDRDLRQLISTFDGNRHLVAQLDGPGLGAGFTSSPLRGIAPAPAWFAALLDPRLPPIRIAVPSPGPAATHIVLRPMADADIADSWRQAAHEAGVLIIVGMAGVGLVYVTIGRALRPLEVLAGAFAQVGAGDYGARVDVRGPKELARLGRSFNSMAGDLAAMRRRTRVLEEQILKLQDEERAELARDLHDEIGPHLFAANIDATMIGQALKAGRTDEALGHVKSIQAAVARMQRQVREILGRLRPARLTELGFCAAIEDLVDFWRARRRDVTFAVTLALDETILPDALQEMAYRVVQEGLSNAVRHAHPSRIAVEVALDGQGGLKVRVSDDGLARDTAPGAARFGLIGMRERVEAVGGEMTIDQGPERGWTITARAPLPARDTLETAASA